jgi:hypothetical protein
MDAYRIDRWVQGLSALGIFAGLVLVALELNQSARLVRAELGAGSMSYRQTLLTSVQGETLAAALAAAIEAPAALTREQQVILDAWYANVVGQVLRQRYLLRLGVFEDPIEPFAAVQARAYFGNSYARAWWSEHRADYPSALRDLLDEEIDALPVDRDRQAMDRVRRAAAGAD